jgi:polyisoprenoid-binding protein YceI
MSTQAPSALASYSIDTAHTHAQFKVRHLMISNVRGEFSTVTGSVVFNPNDPAASKIRATIDTSTINTRDAQRDAHLKSADFFDVARYPKITFESNEVTASGPESFEVAGDLTIRDRTSKVALQVEDFTPEQKDPWGNVRRGATAKTKINRKNFGLEWNVALETGGFLVGDDIDITIDVELIRQP